jgi:hypothetical protein
MEKQMKTRSKINGYIIRSTAYAAFLSFTFIAASSALNVSNRWHKSAWATGGFDAAATITSQPRALTFAERVAFQRAIEDVYWRHRIWPRENPDPKPSLDAVMSQAQLENKVAGYLCDSLALEDYWQSPITAEQLQSGMARDTKQPEVLRELFEALGNDPAVIAEGLARQALTRRLIVDLSARGKTQRFNSPRIDELRMMSILTPLGQVAYTLPRIVDAGDPPCPDNTWTATSTTDVPDARFDHTAVWTGSAMIVWGGNPETNTGGRYCAPPGPTPTPTPTPTAAFFKGEIPLGNGVYYLQFANGTPFGYYSYLSDPRWIYHFDMGYEYWFDANDGHNGIYVYDLASTHFFYTSPSFPFPYLYDFSLNTVLYYLPNVNPGRYTHNPRWFYNFTTGQWITL